MSIRIIMKRISPRLYLGACVTRGRFTADFCLPLAKYPPTIYHRSKS